MSAGRFVGRVGGLAVAFGVGMAAYAAPVAWAQSGDDGAVSGRADSSDSAGAQTRAHRAGRSAPGGGVADGVAGGSGAAGSVLTRAAAPSVERDDTDPVPPALDVSDPAPADPEVSSQPLRENTIESEVPPSAAGVPAASAAVSDQDVATSADIAAPGLLAEPVTVTVSAAVAPDVPVAVPAPVDAVRGVVTTVEGSAFDPFAALGGVIPTDSPLAWALMAVARRQPLAASATDQPAAQVTASAIFGGDSISTNPTVVWKDGVLTGTLGATTSSGDPLSYVGVSDPNLGGKLGGGPLLPLTNFGPGGSFSYIPYSSTLTDASKTETFKVMVLENSPFDQAVENLLGPLGGLLLPQALAIIHRIPIVGDLLSPIIGQAEIVKFEVNPASIANGRPTAFTYKVESFDGTLISVNFFPAINVANGTVANAPTVLAASGLACAANTDPNTVYGQLFPLVQFGSLTPGIKPLREDAFKSSLIGGPEYNGGGGYNVLTWDPRGEFASGGELQIDNPFYEGRDVSAIISWLTSSDNVAKSQVKAEAGDPRVGMTGGSYGGGIQLTTVDPRIDALIPEIAWNSLITSLYPNEAFKTGWGSILAAALAFTGARVNPAVYQGIFTGALFGFLSPSSEAVLASVGPTVLLSKEQAPTLLMQGIHDTLFPLAQSVANGQTIQTSPDQPPLKLFWFCGGHGDCDIPNKPNEQDAQGVIQNLKWLDQYVSESPLKPADGIPTFQWYDQKGLYYNSDYLPWDARFNQGSYTANGDGGFLGLWPILGGSNRFVIDAGKAWNALNTDVIVPAGKQVVGSPTVSFTYSGLGTGHTVYAQLVDNSSGRVLSNIVTPVPVTLDGRERTVTIPLEDIVYTSDAGDSLTLQITSSASNYENFWSYGWINVSDVQLDMPLHTKVAPTIVP